MDDDIYFNKDAARKRIFGGLNYEEAMPQQAAQRMPVGALNSADPMQTAYDEQMASLSGIFEQANNALRAKLDRGESKGERMERLLTLAAALGQPTKTGSFGEQLGNLNLGLVSSLQGPRERREKLEEQLAANQQAQALALAKLKAEYAIESAKPRARRTGFNPVTGVLMDLDTNMPVMPPAPKIGEVRDGYEYTGGSPGEPSSWRKVG